MMTPAELRTLNLRIFNHKQQAIDLSRMARRAREMACWARNPKSGMNAEMAKLCQMRFEAATTIRDDNAAMLLHMQTCYIRENAKVRKARVLRREVASAIKHNDPIAMRWALSRV